MEVDETMSSEESVEESHSASGGLGDDEEVSDSANNNTMQEEDRLRLKAPIWSCAVKVGDTAKCKFCPKVLKVIDGSTSSITKHVKSAHSNRAEVREMIKILSLNKKLRFIKKNEKLKKTRSQSSIMNFTNRRGVLDNLQKKQIDNALVKMVVTMNKPFSDIENSFFRKFNFLLNRNYLAPSRFSLQRSIDKEAVNVKLSLKKEILKDTEKNKFVTIATDHGTGHDVNKSKKNVVTLSRTTEDFVIKTDTVALICCEGSQTGVRIRQDVKDALEEGKALLLSIDESV